MSSIITESDKELLNILFNEFNAEQQKLIADLNLYMQELEWYAFFHMGGEYSFYHRYYNRADPRYLFQNTDNTAYEAFINRNRVLPWIHYLYITKLGELDNYDVNKLSDEIIVFTDTSGEISPGYEHVKENLCRKYAGLKLFDKVETLRGYLREGKNKIDGFANKYSQDIIYYEDELRNFMGYGNKIDPNLGFFYSGAPYAPEEFLEKLDEKYTQYKQTQERFIEIVSGFESIQLQQCINLNQTGDIIMDGTNNTAAVDINQTMSCFNETIINEENKEEGEEKDNSRLIIFVVGLVLITGIITFGVVYTKKTSRH